MAKKGALLLAGLAAFAYYKYTKMSAEQKETIKNNIKEKGKSFWEGLPDELKNVVNRAAGRTEDVADDVESATS